MPGLACIVMVVGELHAVHFPDRHDRCGLKETLLDTAYDPVRSRPVAALIHRKRIPVRHRRLGGIGKAWILLHVAYSVNTEAINAIVYPPLYHAEDLIPQRFALPVQIWLLLCKKMEIVLSPLRAPLPGAPAEAGRPVVRLMTIDRILPDIVIAVLSGPRSR